MWGRASIGLFCLAGLASAGCAAGPYDAAAPAAIEEPLALSVESVTLRRGGLRITASMDDGSSDVSIRPGEGCAQYELGRGFATRTMLAWNLTSEELAVGLECGLVVRARVRDDDGRLLVRSATLPVAISLDTDEPGARVTSVVTHGSETRLVFVTATYAQRVHVAGVVVGGPPRDPEAERTGPRIMQYRNRVMRRLHKSTFEVANVDLARALVQQRTVGVAGASFDVLASVGGTSLDLEKPEESE